MNFGKMTLVSVCALGLSAMAYAGPPQNTDPTKTKINRFEELKDACANPRKYQNQFEPNNIEMECTDTVTKWEQVANEKVELPTSRNMGVSITSSKYFMDEEVEGRPSQNQNGDCTVYEQITLSANVPLTGLTCAQIKDFAGTGGSFCESQILEKKLPASAYTVQRSGSFRKYCNFGSAAPAPAPAPVPAPQKGDRGQ